MTETRTTLVNAAIVEITRVWGAGGLQGTAPEYAWLFDTYGISEEEDVQWQLVFEYQIDEMLDEDLDDEEVMAFVEDDAAVIAFLHGFLVKYRSSAATYPR
jgi:predicted 3-demethylubiquinone-9 3-methyltransferase (glyoxalase superfamily)